MALGSRIVCSWFVLLTFLGTLRTATTERCEDCVIVIIAYNRPDYFSQVLSSLGKCVGIHRYDVHIFVEPENAEVISLARNFNAARSWVHVNPRRLGCHANKKQSVAFGFNVSDFVIVIEDDTPLSPDALLFFEHAKRAYALDKRVFSVSAFGDNCGNREERVPKFGMSANANSYRYSLARRQHYTPWVWGTWRDRWEDDIRDRWDGWDVQMNFRTPPYAEIAAGRASPDFSVFDAGIRLDRYEIFPVLSRSNNIGIEGGIHKLSGHSNYLYHWAGHGEEKKQAPPFHSPIASDSFFEIRSPLGLSELCNDVPFRPDTTRTLCARIRA